MKLNLVNEVVHRSIGSAPTLKVALERFLYSTAKENETSAYSIINTGHRIQICKRRRIASKLDPNIYTDLDFFIDLISIIRQFAGKKWRPRRIALQFWPPVGGFMTVYFPNTHIICDSTSSWVELPSTLLTLSRQDAGGWREPFFRPTTQRAKEAIDFVCALKRALRAHLSEGYPGLDFAAEITHTSVRTLQRNLARAGLTYSKVVEFARFEVAAEMLMSPNLRIIEIAYALGYQDPSHFSRAFRRIAGQTPREFRAARIGGSVST